MTEALSDSPVSQREHIKLTAGFSAYRVPLEQYLRFVSPDFSFDPTDLVQPSDIVRRGDEADQVNFYRFCREMGVYDYCPYDEVEDQYLYPYEIALLYREERAWREEWRELPSQLSVAEIHDFLGAPASWVSLQLRNFAPNNKSQQLYMKGVVKYLRQQKMLLPDIPAGRLSLLELAAHLELNEEHLEMVAAQCGIGIQYHIDNGVLVATIKEAAANRLKKALPLGGDWMTAEVLAETTQQPSAWIRTQMTRYGMYSEDRFDDDGNLAPHFPPVSERAARFEDIAEYHQMLNDCDVNTTDSLALGALFSQIRLERTRLVSYRPHAHLVHDEKIDHSYERIARARTKIIDLLGKYR